MLTHWPVLLAVLAGGWLVFGLSTTLGRLTPMKKPLRRIRKEYLSSVIAQREKLEIEGIPAPLLYELADLEAVFIPQRFKPYQAQVDQELTERSSERLRADVTSGEVPPENDAVVIAPHSPRKSRPVRNVTRWMQQRISCKVCVF